MSTRPLILNFAVPEKILNWDPAAHFDNFLRLWVMPNGEMTCHSRAGKPYTNAYTNGHTVKAGYTPSGKYKPQKYVPGKYDRRSGK
jgi:hypothetical protein